MKMNRWSDINHHVVLMENKRLSLAYFVWVMVQ